MRGSWVSFRRLWGGSYVRTGWGWWRGRADYFSRRAFFSSGVRTSCRGTRVWWTMLTRRSASENSSSRYWADMATITCGENRDSRFWGGSGRPVISLCGLKGSYFPERLWWLAGWTCLREWREAWDGWAWRLRAAEKRADLRIVFTPTLFSSVK